MLIAHSPHTLPPSPFVGSRAWGGERRVPLVNILVGTVPQRALTLLLVGVVDPVAVRDTTGLVVLAPEGVGVPVLAPEGIGRGAV